MASSNKTIRLKLETKTEGGKDVQELSLNLKDLGKVLDTVNSKANRGIKLGVETVSLAAAMDMVGKLNGMIQSLSQAYAVQEQAEMKLATAMRNTMAATDDEIQSIKELCSAQQELGVIGDEVQLQGAQELSRFLQTSDALKELIPAMNDLVAQQYGIGASGENAAAIATKLGKVMQGNATALSRLGIQFSDAEEEIIKFGSEEERAAILAEVIERNVGGMNAQLAQTDSGKMAQLNNTIGDIKESVGKAVSGIAPYLNILSEVAMASLGLGTVTKGLASTFPKLATTMKGAAVSAKAFAFSLKGLMISTGVGAALVALSWVISALSDSADEATGSTKALQEAEEEGNKAAANAVTQIREQKAHLVELVKANQDTAAAVAQLNEQYGSIFGTYQTAADWIDVLSSKERNYAKLIAYRGKQQAIANKIAEAEVKRDQLKQQQSEIQGHNEVKSDGYAYSIGESGYHGMNAADRQYNAIQNQVNEVDAEIAAYEAEMSKIIELAQDTADTLKEGAAEVTFDKTTASLKELQDRQNEVKKNMEAMARTKDNEAKLEQYRSEYEELGKLIDAERTRLGLSAKTTSGGGKSTTKADKDKEAKEAERAAQERARAQERADSMVQRLQQANQAEYIANMDDGAKKELAIIKKAYDDRAAELDALEKELTDQRIKQGKQGLDESETELLAYARQLNEKTRKKAEDELTLGVPSIAGVATNDKFAKGSIDDKRQSLRNANSQIDQLKSDFYNGFVDASEAQRIIDEINAQLQAIGLEPLTLTIDADTKSILTEEERVQKETEALNKKMESTREVAQGIGTLGSSFTQLGDSIGGATGTLLEFTGTMLQSVAQMLPQIMKIITAKEAEAIASGTASAAQAPWVMVIPMIAAVVGSIVGMFSSLPKFADGGIAYGPTLGLFGEYAGASTNPEVVAPLNTLTQLIKPENDGIFGKVVFVMKGRRLEGVLQAVNKLHERS